MDSIKVPDGLTRRGTRDRIIEENGLAQIFANDIKVAVVADIIANHPALPQDYVREAADELKITRSVDWFGPKYSASSGRPEWGHVWSFRGTRNRTYSGETKMVIRTDGTVNVEQYYDRIWTAAHSKYVAEENRSARAKVAEAIGSYTPPEGYEVEATATGAYVRYVGEGQYDAPLRLNVTVDPKVVDILILEHSRWVKAYTDITK